MNVAVTLASGSPPGKPEVGGIVKLQVFIDEKVGSAGDGWEIDAPAGAAWLPTGGVTLSTASVRAIPSDGNATKLELEAMVHQPGPLTVGSFLLRNQVSKEEIEVPQTVLSEAQAEAGAAPKEEPPWLQPAVAFGGLNWLVVALVLAVLAALAALFGRSLWRKLRGQVGMNLTHTDRALNALANLQKFTRSKKPLQLEEWKKFSFELAGILRKFSDENFRIDSSDMTDRELLQELRRHQAASAWVSQLEGILGTITEVRYGRKELETSLVPGLLLEARKFVESTSTDLRSPEPARKGAAK